MMPNFFSFAQGQKCPTHFCFLDSWSWSAETVCFQSWSQDNSYHFILCSIRFLKIGFWNYGEAKYIINNTELTLLRYSWIQEEVVLFYALCSHCFEDWEAFLACQACGFYVLTIMRKCIFKTVTFFPTVIICGIFGSIWKAVSCFYWM